jgi:hypothetical protein
LIQVHGNIGLLGQSYFGGGSTQSTRGVWAATSLGPAPKMPRSKRQANNRSARLAFQMRNESQALFWGSKCTLCIKLGCRVWSGSEVTVTPPCHVVLSSRATYGSSGDCTHCTNTLYCIQTQSHTLHICTRMNHICDTVVRLALWIWGEKPCSFNSMSLPSEYKG